MKGIRINKSIEIFFVILIIIGLCISAVVLMDAGKKAYGRILDNNSQLENARIALSYLGMRLRQNNTEDSITYLPSGIEGSDVVKLEHTGDFEGMVTYIYFSRGELKEIYTWAGGEPDPEFSEAVVSLNGLDIDFGDGYFKFTAHYTEDGNPRIMEQIIGVVTN